MQLPDLDKYRKQLIEAGASYPLNTAGPVSLKTLPAPPKDKSGWPWTEETDPGIYAGRKDWPKVTIVTPSYNQADFLEQTIRSVLLQNYPNLEYIIIDGGSKDGSKTLLNKYAPWLSYGRSEADNGQSHAINLGFSIASGEFYGWINSDDYYLKNSLYIIVDAFLNKKADFVYGYVYNYHVKTKQFELIKVPPLLDYFIKIPMLAQPACFWRSGIHKPVWEEMYCSMDYELWLRLVKGHKRARIAKPIAVANVHDDAKTNNPDMKGRWQKDHEKMWSAEGHGPVPEWKRIVFFNRIRMKLYKLLKII